MKKSIFTLLSVLFVFAVNAQTDFITTWKTDNNGTSNDNQITIPTFPGETYDYTVDWGDGNTDASLTGTASHTYASSGTYTVKISGAFPRIYFNDTAFLQVIGDEEKLVSIEQWGTNPWTSMDSAFAGCTELKVNATDSPNLSNLQSLRRMFFWAGSWPFTVPDIETWDISNVTNLSGMFDKTTFNQDLSAWNFSTVTDMSYLFFSSSFNQDVSTWDVSNVTNMEGLFGSGTFRQDVTGWDVSNVTNMAFMFNSTYFDQDISSWDVSKVTNMRHMLSQCSFNQDISNWNVGQVADMSNIFDDSDLSRENYDKILIGWSQLPSLRFGVQLGANDAQYCLGKDARAMLASNFSWSFSDRGENCEPERPFITTWKTDNPGFSNDNQITIPTTPREQYNYNVDWGDGTSDSGITEDITHTYSSPGTYQVSISGRFPAIYFNGSENIISFPRKQADANKILSIDQWGTNRWINLAFAFAGCSNLDMKANDLPDLSRGTNVSAMFLECTSLIGNKTMSQWDVSNTFFTMSNMFQGASKFNQPIQNWDVSKIRYMRSMFEGATAFNQNLENWDVSIVEDMTTMFKESALSSRNYDKTLQGWSQLPSLYNAINLGAQNTTYCTSETARQQLIDNYNWVIEDAGKDCSKTDFVTTWKSDNPGITNDNQIMIPTFSGEFYNYTVDWGDGTSDSAVTGDIVHTYASPGTYQVAITGQFPRIYHDFAGTESDPKKLLSVDQWGDIRWSSMENAFNTCSNLDVLSEDTPDLSNVTNMTYMFRGCSSLVGNTAMTKWDTSAVTSFIGVFIEAGLFNQDIGSWNVCNATSLNGMFVDAYSFNQNLNGWDVSKVTDLGPIFSGATLFDQPMDNWDVSRVTNFNGTFARSSFNHPLDSWDTSSGVDMSGMFADTAFNQDISNWDISSAEYLGGMFLRNPIFDQNIGSWDTRKVTDLTIMFAEATSFNQDIGNWNIENVVNMNGMFSNSALSTKNYDLLLNSWATQSLQSSVTFDVGNSTYCDGETARQTLIDTFGWEIIDLGKNVNCNLDIDSDGVLDHLDSCLDTPLGDTVNENGCSLLSSNNFLVQSTGETCPDKNNAQISIEATAVFDYTATINGKTYDFTDSLIVKELPPGAYSVCISLPSQSFEQCYMLEINESAALSGKFVRENGKMSVAIDQGNGPFNVLVNNKLTLRTSLKTFTVDADEGDTIEVTTDKVCQGAISKQMEIVGGVITAYPNPTKGSFEIEVPMIQKEVTIEIFNIHSQLISSEDYQVSGGVVQLNIEDLTNGMYFVKINSQESKTVKIIKQ